MLEGDAVYTRHADVLLRVVAGENILVPIRGNLASLQAIFMVNRVGAFVWEALDGARTLDEILAGLLDRFEVSEGEARADLTEFLGKLVESGLVDRLR
jgi:hypothetical protein